MGYCVSWYCWKRGICQNESSAYIYECAGFLNQDCEIDDKKCSLIPCQNGNDCNDISNVSLNLTYKRVVLKDFDSYQTISKYKTYSFHYYTFSSSRYLCFLFKFSYFKWKPQFQTHYLVAFSLLHQNSLL